jgi:hypothetical protein
MKTMFAPAARVRLAMLACVAALPQVASAEIITWGTAQAVSGTSDVQTQGTLFAGFNVGAAGVSGTTVNTVPFTAFPFPTNYTTRTSGTISSVFFQETAIFSRLVSSNAGTSGSAPYSGLPSDYKTLLSSYGYSDSALTLQVSIGGLAIGQNYLIQVWSSVSNQTFPFGTTRFSGQGDSGHFVDLSANTTSQAGGVGQYAVGTFTAAGSTLVVEMNGQSGALPVINALQIRAVPEPSTYVLAGVGAAALALARCRNRRRAPRWTAC